MTPQSDAAVAATPAPGCAPGIFEHAPAARAAAVMSAAGGCSPQSAKRASKIAARPWKMRKESLYSTAGREHTGSQTRAVRGRAAP